MGPIFVTAQLNVGEDSWIGADFKATGNGHVYIGANCDIAPEVTFATGGHEIGDSRRRAGRGVTHDIKIGNGNWIGQRCLLIQNASLGDGCVMGAGTILVSPIEENDVLVAGVPGKIIKHYDDLAK